MLGFFNLKSNQLSKQKETGDAIVRLMQSVGDTSAGSEWMDFKADPKAWVHKNGYVFDGPGAGPTGEVPANLKLVPVYDTADTMHVRIPYKGLLDPLPTIVDETPYGAGPTRFPVFMARYFMRRCR
jgi:hypothetical protein